MMNRVVSGAGCEESAAGQGAPDGRHRWDFGDAGVAGEVFGRRRKLHLPSAMPDRQDFGEHVRCCRCRRGSHPVWYSTCSRVYSVATSTYFATPWRCLVSKASRSPCGTKVRAGLPSARVPSGTWVASASSAPAPTRQDSPTTTPCRQVDIDPIRVPLLTTAPSRWALWPTTQSSPDGVGVNEGGRIDVGVTVAEAVDGHSS